MALRRFLGAASIPFIGCVTLMLALTLHILSFAMPFWAADDVGDFGLWRVRRCIPVLQPGQLDDEVCYQWDHPWKTSDWLKIVQALESFTILLWVIPVVVIPVYIYVALGLYYRCFLGTMTTITIVGVASSGAGVIIFGIRIADSSQLSLRWCLPVCAAGSGLGFIAFIIFLIAVLNRPKFKHDRHFVSGFYVDPDRDRMYVVENIEMKEANNPRHGNPAGAGHVNEAVVGEY
ncbi:hypothetical protein RRG08_058572 [Elysia crispata]|uniref:Uncharacterized protein n=1 Tax=Elysia crispata TaxID=231223 RepID=A0AAE1CMT4_9GAST|nr:hypothetical protein RRG08_058572 [Elysia crispata]